MAQDIGQDIATAGPTVTLLGSNLADGATSAVTSSVDFGAVSPNKASAEVKLDCQASANDVAILHIVWSNDDSDFGDTNNKEAIMFVKCVASTTIIKVADFKIKARYAKFYLENQTGGQINSGASTTLLLTDNFGDFA